MRLTRLRLATATAATGLLLLPGTAALAQSTGEETTTTDGSESTEESTETDSTGETGETDESFRDVIADLITTYLVGMDVEQTEAEELGGALADLLTRTVDAFFDLDDGEGEEPATETEEETSEEATEDEGEGEEDAEEAALVEDEEEDDLHGEIMSALNACLPRGNELHGTGLNHGMIVSAVARGADVVLPALETEEESGDEGTDAEAETEEVDGEADGDTETFIVETVEDVEPVCEHVQALADATEAPEKAKGRPAHAGPKDDAEDGEDADTEEVAEAEDEADEEAELEAADADDEDDEARGRGNGRGNGKGRGNR